MTRQRIAIVVKGYPRLSETFIAQEIKALEDAGAEITIVSLRAPTEGAVHPLHRAIGAPVLYLPEYLWHAPLRVWRVWRRVRRLAGYRAARATWLRDLSRDPTPNRIRRFGQALVLAAELDPAVRHLHAHFLHTPASVARYAALMTGRTWSASAHAVDIYTTPDWELRDKIADADWLVTCTAANRDYLQARAATPAKIALVYHGIDLARFDRPPEPCAPPGRIRVLSVCRLVEKKGMDVLLRALARLPADLDWRFVHVGGGPLAGRMRRLADELGVATRIEWKGALPQDAVLAEYRAADIFALASRIARSGDRDGLPNVLLEAASQALPCVATEISAIPELVRDDESGLLVAPDDVAGFADALVRLSGDAALRHRLGQAGAERVRCDFDFSRCVAAVLSRFGIVRRLESKVA